MINKLLDNPYFDESEIDPQHRAEVLCQLGSILKLYTKDMIERVRSTVSGVRGVSLNFPDAVSEETLLEEIKKNIDLIAKSIEINKTNSIVKSIQEDISPLDAFRSGNTVPIFNFGDKK